MRLPMKGHGIISVKTIVFYSFIIAVVFYHSHCMVSMIITLIVVNY